MGGTIGCSPTACDSRQARDAWGFALSAISGLNALSSRAMHQRLSWIDAHAETSVLRSRLTSPIVSEFKCHVVCCSELAEQKHSGAQNRAASFSNAGTERAPCTASEPNMPVHQMRYTSRILQMRFRGEVHSSKKCHVMCVTVNFSVLSFETFVFPTK